MARVLREHRGRPCTCDHDHRREWSFLYCPNCPGCRPPARPSQANRVVYLWVMYLAAGLFFALGALTAYLSPTWTPS